MLGDSWKDHNLTCPKCNTEAKFRIAHKHAQFLNGRRWEEIVRSAEIVLCTQCGGSIFISSVKEAAEIK